METGKFYEGILGLTEGWTVKNVERSDANETVYVQVVFASGHYKCPNCSKDAAPHDKRERVVQHSDTCEYKTMLNVEYPRVKCLSCGVKAIIPPFAAANSRFTKAFEKRILQLCFSSSVQKVAKDLKLHWHVVDRMKRRAIKRGLDRMKKRHGRSVKNIAIDETSFQKRHNYSTIVTDADRGTVLAVLPERDADTVVRFFQNQQFSDFSKLQSIALDMAPPYIKAIRDFFPRADSLICFDRFHVAQLFNRALDTVRRRESARYRKGENPFVRTRFDWLRNSGKTDNRTSRRRRFLALTRQRYLNRAVS